MPHHTPLIATISVGLVLAFAFGLLAHRLRISPLVGYLLAGVAVGPFTPGFVADAELAAELAEIGVILLMFAVGLHFSLKDLMSVRNIAVPGAVVQIAVATLMGMALAWGLGWSIPAGMVFGLALSVASTVVLTRALGERRLLETERGRIAVGWLVVEDLVMVVALVLLPVVGQISAGGTVSIGEVATILGITLAKVSAFVAVMLLVGRRVIPMIMHYVAHTGSRELFRLAVYALALGVAAGAVMLTAPMVGGASAATAAGARAREPPRRAVTAARAATARNARNRSWTCGWDSHVLPSCFQMKATASRRSTCAPWFARNSISPAMAWKTSGLA